MVLRACIFLLVLVGCGSGGGKSVDSGQAARTADAATPVAPAPVLKAEWPVLPEVPVAAARADSKCGAFGGKQLASVTVLNGRMSVMAPEGSSDIPRAYDVMGAPEPTDHESRVILEAKGGEKFVVFVRELFQTEPVDPKEPMKYLTDAHELSQNDVEFFGNGKPGFVLMRPKQPVVKGQAVLLASALIGGPDTPLKSIDYYVSDKTFKRGATCQSYAVAALQALALKDKKLALGGSVETLRFNDNHLKIEVPKNFVFTNQQGPDFELYFVRKLAPLGRYPGHMLIYIGHHPDETAPEGSGPSLSEAGRLLGKPVKWIGHRGDKSGVLQASVPVNDQGLTMQVIRYATLDSKFVDELLPIAQSIRVDTAKAPR